MMKAWEEGWDVLFTALNALGESNLTEDCYIRGEALSIDDAIQRQLSHYAYHIGQIVYQAKNLVGTEWQSLSIPLGKSKEYNAKKKLDENKGKHFTDNV